jgi:hypothetical protein
MPQVPRTVQQATGGLPRQMPGSQQDLGRGMVQGAKAAVENVLPGASDAAAARDSYLIGQQIGPALREGRYGDAVKAFLDSTTAALGSLPMVPSMVGMTRALHGANMRETGELNVAKVAGKEGAAMVMPDDVRAVVERAKAYSAESNRRDMEQQAHKPASLRKKPEDYPAINQSNYTSNEHQADLHRIAQWIEERQRWAHSEPGVFWRGTDRPGEHADVLGGKAIVSTNHIENRPEPGMSVATSPSYIAMHGYDYGYQVRGDVIGIGSDGEPILANVRPSGPIMPREQVLKQAEPMRQAMQARGKEIADILGVSPEEVGRLVANYGPRPSVELYKPAAERAAEGMSALADPLSWVKD